MDKQQILNELKNFTGSENFYKDYLNCLMTDGFKFICDNCKCYWLFSDLAVIVMDKKIKENESFIVGRIKVNLDKSADVNIYRDYSEDNEEFNKSNLLNTQHYNYTDFPFEYFDFYICLNELNSYTFLLKSEY